MDGGRRWRQVIAGGGPPRDLVMVPGEFVVACSASHTSMVCSDDAGRTWFDVGRGFDEVGQGTLVNIGQELYLAQGGQLNRLERIVNREIPSTMVYFASNARRPKATMHPFLRQIAELMRNDPSLVLRVEGHADKRGSDTYNEALAADRAKSIVEFIATEGIDVDRMSSLSYGERRPIRSGVDGASLAKNRRVEIILMRPSARLALESDPCDGL